MSTDAPSPNPPNTSHTDKAVHDTSARFILEEFIALREEIEHAKERAFKLSGIGILAIPALAQLSQHPTSSGLTNVVILLLPLIVVAIVLIFLAENRAICRCGTYIRKEIEPCVDQEIRRELKNQVKLKDWKWKGWEEWLEEPQTRAARQAALLGFYLLFAAYYLATSYLAVNYIVTLVPDIGTNTLVYLLIITLYAVPGLLTVYFVIFLHITDFGERFSRERG